jgi:hypothetical protein
MSLSLKHYQFLQTRVQVELGSKQMRNKMECLFGPFSVPANATRLHYSYHSAIASPEARVGFEIDLKSGVLTNSLFDESKIVYDKNYCTTNVDVSGNALIPTMEYFTTITEKYGPFCSVVDIGCGQGEFVKMLRTSGQECIGFDPVLKCPNEFLNDRFWTPEEPPAELFVMRCVLPHIASPWEFLDSVWLNSPTAFVLVEYQRIEWIAEKSIFSQISHDHVHQFVLGDFIEHVELIEHGIFAEGEWQWVLLRKSSLSSSVNKRDLDQRDFRIELMKSLQTDSTLVLETVRMNTREGENITIWGAGSKGAIFAYHLIQLGISEFSVVDSDLSKEGYFLESSGIQVLSPKQFHENTEKNMIIMMNPRHVDHVRPHVREFHEVITLQRLAAISRDR